MQIYCDQKKVSFQPAVPALLRFLLPLFLLAGCTPACDIIAAGVFERLPVPEGTPAPALEAGALDHTRGLFPQLAAYRLARETDELEARADTGFGFQYALAGFMERKDVTATVLHPLVTTPGGETRSSVSVPWNVNRDSISWWFVRAEDRVPGDWTLRIEHQGRALCEQRFLVRVPRPASPPAADS